MQKHSRLSISNNLKKSNHVEGAFVGAGLKFNVHSLVIVYGSEKGRNLEVKTAVVVTNTHMALYGYSWSSDSPIIV